MSSLTAPPIDLAPQVESADPADHAMPTGREEQWRFAPLAEFSGFFTPGARGHVAGESESSCVRTVDGVHGRWVPTSLPAAIARSSATLTVHVDIPSEATIDAPIEVQLRASASPAVQQVLVTAGAFSRATVVVTADPVADAAGAIEVELADGADLTLVLLVDGDHEHRLIADLPVRIGRDARLTAASVVLGGRAVRLLPAVHYAAPGGSAEVLGVFLAEGEQYIEQRVFVEHTAPHCTSRVVYKGALSGGAAHTVWIGDVLVRREAIGTDTYELNRNLLLTEGPRADSVPNLELETGDVRSAGHASATGRFDDEQLFYLMARGIPEELARQLVVRGFFADVVARIPSADWRAGVMSRIEDRLGLPHLRGDDE